MTGPGLHAGHVAEGCLLTDLAKLQGVLVDISDLCCLHFFHSLASLCPQDASVPASLATRRHPPISRAGISARISSIHGAVSEASSLTRMVCDSLLRVEETLLRDRLNDLENENARLLLENLKLRKSLGLASSEQFVQDPDCSTEVFRSSEQPLEESKCHVVEGDNEECSLDHSVNTFSLPWI